jgi:hypothetical protein
VWREPALAEHRLHPARRRAGSSIVQLSPAQRRQR